jgi:hypothetical protein
MVFLKTLQGNAMAKSQPYTLILPPHKANALTLLWLHLAVGALAFAGFFAILLVFARTPQIQDYIPWLDFFHTALIVHVDLSVLVWMLSIGGLMAHLLNYRTFPALGKTTAGIGIGGMVLIALSAFTGDADPLLNNYIPVLQNLTFFAGLSLFFCGIIFSCFLSAITFANIKKELSFHAPVPLGFQINALVVALGLIAIAISYRQTIRPEVFSVLDAQQFYELTFWSGGHILQFSYALMMMLAWLFLAQQMNFRLLPSQPFVSWLFFIHLLFVLISPLALRFGILSAEYKNFFTEQMRFGLGLAPGILMLFMVAGFLQAKPAHHSRHLYNALVWSVILFTVGGFIGYLIRGSNVIIPAHYHGSIVGVTLALMGFVYLLLPKLGYTHMRLSLARIQPILYGVGQLMHVLGFAISGGYGTLRKTPGAAQTAEGQTALGLMGLGGFLSLIGGLLFVIVVYEALWKGRQRTKTPAKTRSKKRKAR